MFVYADNAATTAVSETAIAAMTHALREVYGNPSSLHQKGREASAALHLAQTTFRRRKKALLEKLRTLLEENS